MSSLPIHKAIQLSDYGIYLKEISPCSTKGEAVKYAHRDDYYIFGLICDGDCSVNLDFKEYKLSKGEIICVQPGQVHSSIQSTGLKAFLLFVDNLFVSDKGKQIIDEYTLNISPVSASVQQLSELNLLFSILSNRMGNAEDDISKDIIQSLSHSVIAIIVEVIQKCCCTSSNSRRCIEITLKFRDLLQDKLYENRSPSYYASLLNISPVYLNEVINAVTGMSVSKYIQNEIILRAKRLLFYTSSNVQEIAEQLGFNDYAYFTKLFTRATGINPTLFRKRYLE